MSFEEIKLQIEEKWKEEIRVKIKEVAFSDMVKIVFNRESTGDSKERGKSDVAGSPGVFFLSS